MKGVGRGVQSKMDFLDLSQNLKSLSDAKGVLDAASLRYHMIQIDDFQALQMFRAPYSFIQTRKSASLMIVLLTEACEAFSNFLGVDQNGL